MQAMLQRLGRLRVQTSHVPADSLAPALNERSDLIQFKIQSLGMNSDDVLQHLYAVPPAQQIPVTIRAKARASDIDFDET